MLHQYAEIPGYNIVKKGLKKIYKLQKKKKKNIDKIFWGHDKKIKKKHEDSTNIQNIICEYSKAFVMIRTVRRKGSPLVVKGVGGQALNYS